MHLAFIRTLLPMLSAIPNLPTLGTGGLSLGRESQPLPNPNRSMIPMAVQDKPDACQGIYLFDAVFLSHPRYRYEKEKQTNATRRLDPGLPTATQPCSTPHSLISAYSTYNRQTEFPLCHNSAGSEYRYIHRPEANTPPWLWCFIHTANPPEEHWMNTYYTNLLQFRPLTHLIEDAPR